jgi:ankyrin repeat protein
VRELAEVLAVDFDDAEGIPKLKQNWRWEDQEQALLTSCSSLIAIVGTGHSRVVQFSHFSVKEYLTSERLATSSGDASRYHIVLEPAHTILAQVCLGVLLQSSNRVEQNGVGTGSPLSGYAARHWVTHARFKSVSSVLRKAMKYLFDLDKPYFGAWLRLHDIDTRPGLQSSPLHWFAVSSKFGTTPLYYASLCGFQDLVGHLVTKYPHHVNTSSGYYVTPLVAALAGRHFQTVKLLRQNGAHVNVRGNNGETPLFSAVWYGDLEMVQVLLDYRVDVNALSDNNWTPIHYVSQGSRLPVTPHNIPQLFPDIARLLLDHGADVNAPINRGSTPLHVAADYGRVDVVRVLLEHGATIGAEDNKGRTPLRIVVDSGRVEIVFVLLERGANVGEEDYKGRTPLHAAAIHGRVEVARVLLEHGAKVDAKDYKGRTPLHAAAVHGKVEVVRVLLEHGANVEAEDNKGRTPFRIASVKGDEEIMTPLSEYGAEGVR